MRTRWIIAAIMALTGLVWIGQGLGILRGSSLMVGDGRWAIGGLVLVAAAILIGWSAVRNRRRA
jgi:hypothetical protein